MTSVPPSVDELEAAVTKALLWKFRQGRLTVRDDGLSSLAVLAARARGYEEALRLIDKRLTTVSGDRIAAGDAAKLAARGIARAALGVTG